MRKMKWWTQIDLIRSDAVWHTQVSQFFMTSTTKLGSTEFIDHHSRELLGN